jgi:hypothetical protein
MTRGGAALQFGESQRRAVQFNVAGYAGPELVGQISGTESLGPGGERVGEADLSGGDGAGGEQAGAVLGMRGVLHEGSGVEETGQDVPGEGEVLGLADPGGSAELELRGPTTGAPVSEAGLRALFRRHRAASGAIRVRPHRLRHTPTAPSSPRPGSTCSHCAS